MKSITVKKSFDEIRESIQDAGNIFLVGCGTCATMCHTGGVQEVLELKEELEKSGKKVTGWIVPPVTCDDLTKDALDENMEAIEEADAILVMSCAFGVQTVTFFSDKPICPTSNTLFMGKEDTPGHFAEVCMQCGECVLAVTGGICPVTTCPKGLLNGPCGGTNEGKCEVSPDIPCAWTRIYERLKKMDRLDDIKKIAEPKDWSKGQRPGSFSTVKKGEEKK
jgi:ferredoxin